jgi:hypothetical protein
MKNFSWAVIAFILALVAIWWGLDSWLHNKELATLVSKGKWISNGREWGIVTAVWPILAAFGFFVAVFFAIPVFWLFGEALESDSRDEIKKLKESVAKSEKNAQDAREELLKAQSNANANARNHAQLLLDEAGRKERHADAIYLKSKEAKEAHQAELDERDARIKALCNCLVELEEKRASAAAYTVRLNKKAEKSIANLEKALAFDLLLTDPNARAKVLEILKPITKAAQKTNSTPPNDKSGCLKYARSLREKRR